MRRITLVFVSLVCAGAATPAALADVPCVRAEQVLEHPLGPGVSFGEAIAASGDWLAVNAASTPWRSPDMVLLYRGAAGQWQLHQQIDSPDGIRDFGRAVAISEDALLISARDSATFSGVLYFYRLESGEWRLESNHIVPGGHSDPSDGSLGVDGDLALVVAHGADVWGRDLGAAFIYQRDPAGRWSLEADITPSLVRSGLQQCRRGWLDAGDSETRAFVKLSGSPLITLKRVGGVWEEVEAQSWPDDGATIEGRAAAHADGNQVTFYERSDERFVPTETVRVESPPVWPGVRLGKSVAFGRSESTAPGDLPDLLVAGDPRARITAYHGGGALLFSRADGRWRLAAQLLMPEGLDPAGFFGSSIAISSGPGRRPFAFSVAGESVAVFALDTLCGSCPHRSDPAGEVTLTTRTSGELTPANPIITFDVLAWFPSSDYALAGVEFDVEASEPAISDPSLILGGFPGTSAGVVEPGGAAVRDALAAQIFVVHLPDPANPILVWTATFTTADFRPRDIELRAIVGDTFRVYPHDRWGETASRLDAYTGTSGVIRVRQTADCDGSGALDFADFLCFQSRFAAGDPRADFNADGALTFFDFLAFQDAFAGGCP